MPTKGTTFYISGNREPLRALEEGRNTIRALLRRNYFFIPSFLSIALVIYEAWVHPMFQFV